MTEITRRSALGAAIAIPAAAALARTAFAADPVEIDSVLSGAVQGMLANRDERADRPFQHAAAGGQGDRGLYRQL